MQHIMHHNQPQATVVQDQDSDHPERMLFFAFIGGILSWAFIGSLGWAVLKLFA